MYLKYFGLDKAPFAITPDPGFVYLSSRHEDALAHLVYGVSRGGGGGFVQLTGEVGTGKTTLCRLLLEQVPEATRIALILNPAMTPKELIASTLSELEVPYPVRATHKRLVDILNQFLLEAHAAGERVVLIIDEAQNLTPQALEQVRLLTNLETETEKLLQIVLIGQPELRDLLQRRDLRQLSQRVTARYHLDSLDAEETAEYIDHRLRVAGAMRNPFSNRALHTLHRRAKGVPRLINIIAERSLLAAYSLEKDRISPRLVDAAADEVLPSRRQWGPPIALGAAAILLIGSASALIWTRGENASRERTTVEKEETQQAVAAPPMQHDLTPYLFPSRREAATALAQLWGPEAPQTTHCERVPAPGWRCVALKGNVTRIERIDRPALLRTIEPDGQWMLLSAVDGESVTLLPAEGARPDFVGTFPWGLIDRHWSGEFEVLFPVHPSSPVMLDPGDNHAYVARLRQRLGISGVNDQYDQALVTGITELQASQGIQVDGSIGPETLLVLERDYRINAPTLKAE